jgi:pimeloyl-ACP methyl ester carboxylesterase
MPVRAVCGHSLGGKVALAYRAARPGGLLDTWVLDASPSARAEPRDRSDPDGVGGVLAALAALPAVHPDRAGFVAALGERGVSRPVAEWLAMNLEPAPSGELRLRLDLAAIGGLLADHDRAELWSALESADLPGAAHVVVAGRSSAVMPPDRTRFAELAAAGRIALHLIPEAGHWLHVEAPDQLLALLADELPALPRSG